MPIRKVMALRAAETTMNRHIRQTGWRALSATINAEAWSAPYNAKEAERLLERCSRPIAATTMLKPASSKKCRG